MERIRLSDSDISIGERHLVVEQPPIAPPAMAKERGEAPIVSPAVPPTVPVSVVEWITELESRISILEAQVAALSAPGPIVRLWRKVKSLLGRII